MKVVVPEIFDKKKNIHLMEVFIDIKYRNEILGLRLSEYGQFSGQIRPRCRVDSEGLGKKGRNIGKLGLVSDKVLVDWLNWISAD